MTSADFVDYATLGVAALGPFAMAWWIGRRDTKSRFDAYVTWKIFGPEAYIEDGPVLHIHNKGKHAIYVTDVSFLYGVWKRKVASGEALYYEDPTDLDYPYEILPGKSRSILLDSKLAEHLHSHDVQPNNAENIFRRPSIWIKFRTADNVEKVIGALEALSYHLLPKWMTHEDD